MKTILISFANNEKWNKSQINLNKSSINKGIDYCLSYNPYNIDENFKLKNKHLLNSDVRGYGFWMWKSIIIKQTLDLINEGDVVIYVDSGNTIINDLNFIINECIINDIILFDNRDSNFNQQIHLNKVWTKRDAFVLMDCDDKKYYDGYQVDASYQLYKKNNRTINFINEFMRFCENENIISDLPNITKENLPEFKDHRHDQSIMSLMAIKHNITLYPEPSEWGNHLNRPYPQLFDHHRGRIF
jgi:hypothetical protein